MPEKILTIPVDIELSQKKVRSICDQIPGSLSDAQKIAGIAESAMQDLADGGAVIPGDVMRQIRQSVGELRDYRELIRYVEAGVGMENGSLCAKWRPDPTYIPVIEETANSQGITVNQHVQQLMDYVAGKGWIFDLRPDTVPVYFSKEDFRAICEMFDVQHVTGTNLASFLKQLQLGNVRTPDEKDQSLLEGSVS